MDATDHNAQQDVPAPGSSTGFGWGTELLTWLFRGLGHLLGTTVVGVLVAWPIVNLQTAGMYVDAVRRGAVAPAWTDLALHFGLAASLWALLVIGWRLFQLRRRERDARKHTRENARIVSAERGSVMTETLIVLVPFLLLTSGLAQLAMRNVAGLMADLALYQGARTAWVWQSERHAKRGFSGITVDTDYITKRARLASAAALAPSAPSDFKVTGKTVKHAGLKELRAIMYMMFNDKAVPANEGEAASSIGDARTAATSGGEDATGEELSFMNALDSTSFKTRAARKLTFAYFALENFQVHGIKTNSPTTPVSVSFDYQMNITFPWFAYIFSEGGERTVGGRTGWYVPIERPREERAGNNHTLPKQFTPAF